MPPKPTTRRCKRCEIEQPLEEFYRGTGSCRSCRRKRSRQWHRENPEAKARYNRRWRERNPQHVKDYTRRWRSENPQKANAKNALYYAVKKGKIKRKPCECCGLEPKVVKGVNRIHGHHYKGYDHENYLNVVWLCRRCHAFAHRFEE